MIKLSYKTRVTAAAVLCAAVTAASVAVSAFVFRGGRDVGSSAFSDTAYNSGYGSELSEPDGPSAENSHTGDSFESPSGFGSDTESAQPSSEASFNGSSSEQQPPEKDDPPDVPPAVTAADAESILAGMTLEQKICQMMIVEPEALTGSGTVTSVGEKFEAALKRYPVSGIIYFAKNLKDPDQVKTMLSATQKYADEIEGVPLFSCVDEEGGTVVRVARNPAFGVPSFPDMAYIKSEDEAYNVGNTIGGYLRELGFNVDFAPVADVLTNPENSVIGKRSFGGDPDIVSRFALNVANGLKANGIISSYKHFPGHGSTLGDTHEGFAYTDKTLDELLSSDLLPYVSAVQNGIDMVMVSHISIPNVIGDDTPSSLSEMAVTDILKTRLGYNGLIVTDGLNMGAVVNNYSAGDAAVMAVKAGNDLLLLPDDLSAAVNALTASVERGEISESRIDDSVIKILNAKLKLQP